MITSSSLNGMYPKYSSILPGSNANYPVFIMYQVTKSIVTLLGWVVKPLLVVSCPRQTVEGYAICKSGGTARDAHRKIESNPYRRLIWAWLKLYLTPERYHLKNEKQAFPSFSYEVPPPWDCKWVVRAT